MDNIFEKACLLQMTTSVWSASKSVDPVLLKELGEHGDWLKGRKNLINPELMGQIRTAAHQARNKVRQYSLPFPIMSIQLVPKKYIGTIEDILQQHQVRFMDKVDEFIGMYGEARQEAKQVLGNLFNELDYPLNIRTKFKFTWQFLALQVPSKTMILSPEIYERERARFENLMYDTRELCLQALRTEFADLLTELTDKLSANGDKPKKIVANSMFNKLNEFFSEMDSRNIFEDQELVELAASAKRIIADVSPYNLKYNEQAKEQIRTEMQTLRHTLESSIIDLPRRTIRMEQPEEMQLAA
jgi:hypothetical protein